MFSAARTSMVHDVAKTRHTPVEPTRVLHSCTTGASLLSALAQDALRGHVTASWRAWCPPRPLPRAAQLRTSRRSCALRSKRPQGHCVERHGWFFVTQLYFPCAIYAGDDQHTITQNCDGSPESHGSNFSYTRRRQRASRWSSIARRASGT